MSPQASKLSIFKRLWPALLTGLAGGLIGGVIAIFGVNDYFSLGTDRSREVILQESSAIIDVVNTVGPSVVNVVTSDEVADYFGRVREREIGAGSGIIIKADGLVLTNKHVVPEGTDHITVTLADGREFKDATVVGRDPLNDIAFIKINANDLPAVELGDSDQVVVGQRVVAIGNALGEFDHTVTSGIISGIGRPVTTEDGLTEAERLKDLLQTDAAINPGNSGGPLVDVEGRVIGINTAVAGEAENIGFAIPINQAKASITSIERTGQLQKAYLGVRYLDLTPEIAKQFDLKINEGAYLTSSGDSPAVLPDTPAAKAGLVANDIIIKVNDETITNKRSLASLIGKYLPGDKIKLIIRRGDETKEIEVTLAALPQ